MTTSNDIDETYVILRYGRPNFGGPDDINRRSDYLCELPSRFIMDYDYVFKDFDGKYRARDKCIEVTNEYLIAELIEFHKRIASN